MTLAEIRAIQHDRMTRAEAYADDILREIARAESARSYARADDPRKCARPVSACAECPATAAECPACQ